MCCMQLRCVCCPTWMHGLWWSPECGASRGGGSCSMHFAMHVCGCGCGCMWVWVYVGLGACMLYMIVCMLYVCVCMLYMIVCMLYVCVCACCVCASLSLSLSLSLCLPHTLTHTLTCSTLHTQRCPLSMMYLTTCMHYALKPSYACPLSMYLCFLYVTLLSWGYQR